MSWLAKLWAWLKPTEQQAWDMAAGTMRFDGWTDFDIELALGPRPKDSDSTGGAR